MVFQDSYSSLNPRMPVQDSVAFGPFVHGRKKPDARRVARDMLIKVGLNPDLFGPRYPHELSGGQKQRVNIARALAIEPRMVILDEAVSALDKSVEAQVLNLLRVLKQQFNLTYLFISHDLNVVRYVSDRVLVMYLGRVVELGPSEDIFTRPLHPYTRALLGSRPSMDPARPHRGTADHRRSAKPDRSAERLPLSHALPVRRGGMRGKIAGAWRVAGAQSHVAACHMLDAGSGHSRAAAMSATPPPLAGGGWRGRGQRQPTAAPNPLPQGEGETLNTPRLRHDPRRATGRSVTTSPSASSPAKSTVHAVNGVSFTVRPGEVLCILGESGSGKSVTLRAMMRLLPPRRTRIEGAIRIDGQDVLALNKRALRDLRGGLVSMIFQEPMTALDPVYTIGTQIAETVMRHKGGSRAEARARALELLELVKIPEAERRLDNYPHELSGGLRQRAMIAMALSCGPRLLLADEPTTALDATVQIQVLILLRKLQRELGMGTIFVTHDLGVASEIADRIAVMYAGRIVEEGPVADVLRCAHASVYTGPAGVDGARPAPRPRHRGDPRQPARSAPPALRLRLRAALRPGDRGLPHHPARGTLSVARAHGALPACWRCRAAAARGVIMKGRPTMPMELSDEALDFLLARAGLSPTRSSGPN